MRICRSVLYLSRPARTFSECRRSFAVFLVSSRASASSELSSALQLLSSLCSSWSLSLSEEEEEEEEEEEAAGGGGGGAGGARMVGEVITACSSSLVLHRCSWFFIWSSACLASSSLAMMASIRSVSAEHNVDAFSSLAWVFICCTSMVSGLRLRMYSSWLPMHSCRMPRFTRRRGA
ncbi:hypothetical protein CRUP_031316 [Coryphaenoides rupestris]|nr:hypothetical protein CRUP_031316 [Coryphaenoides rupestris]